MSVSESDLIDLGHDEEYEDLTPITSSPEYEHISRLKILYVEKIRTRGSELPPPRSGHRMVYSDAAGHVYLVGGYCRERTGGLESQEVIRRDTFMFHTDDFGWRDTKHKGDIPAQLASHYLIAVGQLLLVAGGTSIPFGTVKEEKLFSYNVYDKLWRVTPLRGEKPIPCYGQTLTHIKLDGEEYIYSIGGTTGRFYNMEVHRLRLRDCAWEMLPPKKNHVETPFGRYRHEAIYFNDRIWVFSGMRYDLPDSVDMRMIPAYHVKKQRWRYISTQGQIPPFLSCLTATGHKNYVIITGGYLLTGMVNKSVYLLNLDTREWNIIGYWSDACRFHAAAVVPHKNCLVIFGGMRYHDASDPSSDAVRFNHTWVFKLCFLPPPSLLELSWRRVLSIVRPRSEAKVQDLINQGVPRHLMERYLARPPRHN